MKRPCLDCGGLTTYGSRCIRCSRTKRRERPWYDAAWRRLSAALRRDAACVDCGTTEDLTLDHVDPRSLRAGAVVRCRSCNSKKGNRRTVP